MYRSPFTFRKEKDSFHVRGSLRAIKLVRESDFLRESFIEVSLVPNKVSPLELKEEEKMRELIKDRIEKAYRCHGQGHGRVWGFREPILFDRCCDLEVGIA